MKRNELIRLGILTASMLTLTACGDKKLVKVDPLNQPIEQTDEVVKPAEPIVVSVEPIVEIDEDDNFEIDADIDYYGKEEATQPAPSTPNSGYSTVKDSDDVDEDYSQPSQWAQPAGNGVPYTDRYGGYHTGNTQPWVGGGDGGIFGD